MSFTFTDNSKEVLNKLEQALETTIYAVGIEATGLVVQQMESGYGKPIRQTGYLIGSIHPFDHSVSPTSAKVMVGTNVEYAPFVHYGARGRAGRPFLRDGIEQHVDRIAEVVESYMKF